MNSVVNNTLSVAYEGSKTVDNAVLKKNSALQPSIYLPTIGNRDIFQYRCSDNTNFYTRSNIGGKGLFLYLLQQQEIPVPKFSFISTQQIQELESFQFQASHLPSFCNFIDHKPKFISIDVVKSLLLSAQLSDNDRRNILQELADFIVSKKFYQLISNQKIVQNIRENYIKLINNDFNIPVIVRSSSIAEDCLGNAQAGKYQSKVHNSPDIIITCLEVLASAYNSDVMVSLEIQPMAIVLQHCLDCSFGGVAFSGLTLEDNSTTITHIEYAPGQPKTAVSGVAGIIPHSYDVKITENNICDKKFTSGSISSNYQLLKVDSSFSEQLVDNNNIKEELTDTQLHNICSYIKNLTDIFICPVEIEFAINKADNKVYVLQVRPITKQLGNYNFAVNEPSSYLAKGKNASDGITTGVLCVVNSKPEKTTTNEKIIVVAEQAHEWMLNHDFLVNVVGFIFKYGGINDHIAISLRQENIACMIVNNEFENIVIKYGLTLSMVCGSFDGDLSGYLIEQSTKNSLLQQMSTELFSLPSIMATSDNFVNLEIDFSTIDAGFAWLNHANSKLLDYYDSARVMSIYFSKTKFMQLCMHPERISIHKQAIAEVNNFFRDLTTFVKGFKLFCNMGFYGENLSLADPFAGFLNCEQEIFAILHENQLTILEDKIAYIKHRVISSLKEIEFPDLKQSWKHSKYGLNEIINIVQILKNLLQKLNLPSDTQEISSAHDVIYFLHKKFVTLLGYLAVASGHGEVTETDTLIWVDFLPKENRILNIECANLLEKTDDTKTILSMPGICIITIPQSIHFCRLQLMEPTTDNKGSFCIYYTDIFEDRIGTVQGRYKRMWFVAKSLTEVSGSDNIQISFNESINTLKITINSIATTKCLQQITKKFLKVFALVESLNVYLEEVLIGDNFFWDKNFLAQKLQEINQQQSCDINLALCLFAFSYNLMPKEAKKYDIALSIDWVNTKYREYIEAGKQIKEIVATGNTTDLSNFIKNNQQLSDDFLLFFILLEPKKAMPIAYKIAPYLFRKELIYMLISKDADCMSVIPVEYATDIDFCKQALVVNYRTLKYVPEELKSDKKIIVPILQQNGFMIQHVSSSCRDDIDLVSIALSTSPLAISVVGMTYSNDKNIVKNLIEKNIKCATFMGPELNNNVEIAEYVLQRSGLFLEFFGDFIRDNQRLVTLAAINNTEALKYASKRLLNDFDFASTMIIQHQAHLSFFADNKKITTNVDVIAIVCKKFCHSFKYADQSIRGNKNIIADFIINRKIKHTILNYTTKDVLFDDELLVQLSNEDKSIQRYINSLRIAKKNF